MAPRALLLSLSLLFAACGGNSSPARNDASSTSASTDTAPMSAPDAAADVAADLAPDVAPDVAPDLTADVAPDVAPDLTPDVVLAPDVADAPPAADVAPDLTQDPGQLHLNPIFATLVGKVGTRGSPTTFVASYLGQMPAPPVTVALGGPDAQQFVITANRCGLPLVYGGGCSMEVALNATTAGKKTAVLIVSSPGAGTAQSALTGMATPADQLEILPTSANFPSTSPGASSPTVSFQVKNTGGSATAPLTATTSTAEFVITANTCGGAILAAGASCNLLLVFHPSSSGQKSAVLTVSSAGGLAVVAALSGTGL